MYCFIKSRIDKHTKSASRADKVLDMYRQNPKLITMDDHGMHIRAREQYEASRKAAIQWKALATFFGYEE